MKKLLAAFLCLFALSAQAQVKISDLTRVDPALGTDVVPMSNTSRSTSSSYILSVATIGAYVLASPAITGNATVAGVLTAGTYVAAPQFLASNTSYGVNSGLLLGGINAGIGLTGSNLFLTIPTSASKIYMGEANGNSPFEFGTASGVTPYVSFAGNVSIGQISTGVIGVGTGAAGSTAGAIVAASYWTAIPNTVTTAAYTVPATASYIVTNVAGIVTVTLPAAASFGGRNINIRTITANTVISASSNVVPVAGGAAGTAILAATAGKWARLVSDGVNWNIEMSN